MKEGKSVVFEAKIKRIVKSDKSGTGRILLEDVAVDGEFFRDHVWAKTNKQFANLGLSEGEILIGNAKLYVYDDLDNPRQKKIGLKKLRNLSRGDVRGEKNI